MKEEYFWWNMVYKTEEALSNLNLDLHINLSLQKGIDKVTILVSLFLVSKETLSKLGDTNKRIIDSKLVRCKRT